MQPVLLSIVVGALLRLTVSVTLQRASPVTEVVNLLAKLEARVKADGMTEQKSYDKFMCWCEDTMGRKATDISTAKTRITDLQTLILELEGDVGTHGAQIEQLKRDVEANLAAQNEANEVREKGKGEYVSEKTETEQSIGALEAAITALSGAGTGNKKTGFLETSMQEAQLLSAAAGVRRVLGRLPTNVGAHTLSESDLQAIAGFVEHPTHVFAPSAGSLGALQVAQNPFGDYAPQSTRIQGILKGLYDAFASSLEKANADEADAQKAFQELVATKAAELATLQKDLQTNEANEASKTKDLAMSKVERDDTKKQLDATEVFFQETKNTCKSTATDWAVRCRLRTEELQGIRQAIHILDSPEARAVLANASTTLLQADSIAAQRGFQKLHGKVAAAVARLQHVADAGRGASATKAVALAFMATQAETSGHFDKVIMAIDQMIGTLRKEEKDDIAHRDRCQTSQNKNKNDKEDLSHAINKADSAIDRMENKASELRGEIGVLETEIQGTTDEMKEALELRNKEVANFRQAIQDDTTSVELLSKAIVALTAFYRRNGVPLALAQRLGTALEEEPVYTIDRDRAPEPFEGDYGGRQDDSQPIISMIASIKEDLEMEMKTAREIDAAAQASYEKQRSAAQASLDAAMANKVATEKELAELESEMQDTFSFKQARGGDLEMQNELENTLYQDCSWVETHFESRRSSRKTEIDGLVDAKNFLAGSE